MIAAVRQAAGVAAAARVETAELANAATIVATHWPFAIVMSEDVYSFDAAEFEALARDVNATLIRVDTANATPLVEPIIAMALVRCSSRVRSASIALTAAETAPAPCKAPTASTGHAERLRTTRPISAGLAPWRCAPRCR